MSDPPLHVTARPLTLLGGGPVREGVLAEALTLAPELVAADGGADHPLPAGAVLRAVIGDLDSVRDPAALRSRGVPVHGIADQNSTDLEKCLSAVRAPLILGLGFTGARTDHHLAAMNALVRHRGAPLVLLDAFDLCFHARGKVALDLETGCRVSLFPMAPVRVRAAQGLRWSPEGLAFQPDGRIGTSNEALGGPMSLEADGPGLLVILPQSALRQVVAFLSGP